MQASEFATRFAEQLQAKFAEPGLFGGGDEFTVNPGRKFDKVVKTHPKYGGAGVHAFVERATGYVYKAEGWKKPAAGARYATVEEAVEAADPFGGYLYADAAPGVPEPVEPSYAQTLLNRRFAA